MIDKIEEIITRAYLAEPTGNKRAFPFMNTPEWGGFVKGAAEMQVLELKSLFKEYAMEIIGKDEDPAIYGVWNPLSVKGLKIEKKIMDDKDTIVRNKLRAEQREKLLTITEDKS